MASNPHDALFKRVFSDVTHAAGEFRAVLPSELVAEIDFATLSLCPGSFVDEVLRERHTDLLYSVRLRERDAFLYLLFEHQSTVDALMPYRMLGYVLRIWESWLRATVERIQSADSLQLGRWAERILSAASIDDLWD